MIKSISIRNFQSLKAVDFELGRVTAVSGDSDVGKSAIIRAIRALALNRTSESLFHKKQGPLSVEVVTDRGTVKIEREKGKSAKYVVNGADFIKTGRDVPVEVSDILGIREYAIDTDVKILPAIQSQFGSQFLIQDTDTVVSKTIGRISRLNVVFAALRKASAEIKSLQDRKSAVSIQVGSLERDIKDFDDLVEQEDAIASIREFEASLAETASKVSAAKKLAEELAVLKRKNDVWHNFDEAARHLEGRYDLVISMLHKTVRAEALRNDLESKRVSTNRLIASAKEDIAEQTRVEGELSNCLDSMEICPLTKVLFAKGCVEIIKKNV